MFLELLNNAFLDSTFFYLYLGIILITFGVMYFNNLYNKHFIDNDYVFSDNHQMIKIDINCLEKPLITNEPFVVWLIITFKRIDEKEDEEDNFPSYFKGMFKIRGGQSWNETAYSLTLKNIAF